MQTIWVRNEYENWDGTVSNLVNLCGYRNEIDREFVEETYISETIDSNKITGVTLRQCIDFCKKNYYECEPGVYHTNLIAWEDRLINN